MSSVPNNNFLSILRAYSENDNEGHPLADADQSVVANPSIEAAATTNTTTLIDQSLEGRPRADADQSVVADPSFEAAATTTPPVDQGLEGRPRAGASDPYVEGGTPPAGQGLEDVVEGGTPPVGQGQKGHLRGPYVEGGTPPVGQGLMGRPHDSVVDAGTPPVGRGGLEGHPHDAYAEGAPVGRTQEKPPLVAAPPVGRGGRTHFVAAPPVGQGGRTNAEASSVMAPPVHQVGHTYAEASSVKAPPVHQVGHTYAAASRSRYGNSDSTAPPAGHSHGQGFSSNVPQGGLNDAMEDDDGIGALPDTDTVYTVSGRSRQRARHTKDASLAENWLPFMKKQFSVALAGPNVFRIGSEGLCRMSLMPNAALSTLIDNYQGNEAEQQEEIDQQTKKVSEYDAEIATKREEMLSVDLKMTNIIHQIQQFQQQLNGLSTKKEIATKKAQETEKSHRIQTDLLKQLRQGLETMFKEYHTAKLLTRPLGFHPYRSIPSAAILVAHKLTTQEQWDKMTLRDLELLAASCLELGYSESSEWERNPLNVQSKPFRIHQWRRGGQREPVDEFRQYLQGVFNFNKNFGPPERQPAPASLQERKPAPAPAPAPAQAVPDAATEYQILQLLENESDEQVDLVLRACDDKTLCSNIPRHLFHVMLRLSRYSQEEREVVCGFAKAGKKRSIDRNTQDDTRSPPNKRSRTNDMSFPRR
eukprot:CAMPEP_0113452980 /NCGR_PEP_ID=MMETSP0014_2-20120614/7124_1 /TAXON_ID=2857 /ORGANISM="Nitzschia sp." /LENGTH=698 /DNA_ID=CAMNT_0000344365 /DNA_START=906 /DNA_END=3002 /DNA_ORIENTATION=- /assembly_acc=CAM_ASM_000159